MDFRFAMALLVIGAAVLLFGPGASAHRPIFVDEQPTDPTDALQIPDPDISWAIYAELASGDAHFYRFVVPEPGLEFFAQMTVPARQEYRNFDPWFALVGPDLPRDISMPARLPMDYGALLAPAGGVKGEFFEPFTQTRYILRQKMQEELEVGTHYLVVFHPDGEQGRYALTVGEREAWAWADLLAFPAMWLRVRWWYSEEQTVVLVSFMAMAAVVIIRRIHTTVTRREHQPSPTRRVRVR